MTEKLTVESIEKAYKDAQGEDFVVYTQGLCYASVCSALSRETTVQRMHSIPSGTTNGWTLADKGFSDGTSNPHPCEQQSETHQHYLFEC